MIKLFLVHRAGLDLQMQSNPRNQTASRSFLCVTFSMSGTCSHDLCGWLLSDSSQITSKTNSCGSRNIFLSTFADIRSTFEYDIELWTFASMNKQKVIFAGLFEFKKVTVLDTRTRSFFVESNSIFFRRKGQVFHNKKKSKSCPETEL